jgi:hypothetical protein
MRSVSLLVLLFALGYFGLGFDRSDAASPPKAGRSAVLDLSLVEFPSIDPDYDPKGGAPVFVVEDKVLRLRAKVRGIESLIVDVTLSGSTTLATYTGRPAANGNLHLTVSLPSTRHAREVYVLQAYGVVQLERGQEWHGLWRGDPAGDLPVVPGGVLRVALSAVESD